MKPAIFFLLLIATLGCAASARVLDEMPDPQLPVTTTIPPSFPQAPVVSPELPTNPTDDIPPPVVPPVVGPSEVPGNPADVVPPVVGPTDVQPPVVPPVVTPAAPADAPEPEVGPTDVQPPVVPPVVTPAAPADAPEPEVGPGASGPPLVGASKKPALEFFMHDVLGGSHASGRVVTGIVATSDSSNIPFSKANNQVFPVSGGVPLFNNQVNSIVNNNNAPLLAAMNSQQLQQQQQQSVIQNAGNANNVINGGSSQAFVTAGQLPQGASLQQLMFGSITVIDDEITEGHELGSSVIGSAQGFYLASSLDGESHTMVWTALFHEEHGLDGTISFFGVHRPAAPVSYVAVIGGTGKYENAKGYAAIGSLPQVDQHTTDGVESIVHISVYLS